ncbi:MAG TPA: polysaccharide biosynthesis/export family protein, partial [Pyrinomonadaceae bacterium]|nr:polysaccharide biosynthesis/export family protein [Pyrinomonadaceae bacterium]
KDTSAVAGAANESSSAPAAPVTPTVVQSTILPLNPPAANNASPAGVAARPTAAPSAYAVGVGDVLDIRLSNTPARESTLFTVLKNGTIEYPLLASPLSVVGMATDEIARALSAEIKVIKTPKVSVSVRDYASHTILVTGLVDNPGRKILRRESMPLFAIMAEASVRAEATTLTVTHNGKEGAAISLQDQQAMSALVASGDVIKVSGNSTASGQFVYVGGDVAAPGEKTFRQGMTLTQVIIAAGTNPNAIKAVKIAKRSRDGLLVTSEYNLKSIQQGKSPDPLVEAGDRLEVTRD